MAKAFLRKTRENRVYSGHPWVFQSDIEKVEGQCKPGDILEVVNYTGSFLGRAFYNPASQITLRLLTTKDEPINAQFFHDKVTMAWEHRKRFADVNSCRAIFAESDFLPALVVDKFADILVLQSLSLGMDSWKGQIVEILNDVIKPRGIWERNDVPVRQLEGMEQVTGLLSGTVPDRIEMIENGIKFLVDVKEGQKTGFFLDQKENRAAMAPICKGANVLDCFCHNGSFTLHAAKYGASSAIGVDISASALLVAKENAKNNNLASATFEEHNAFDHLRKLYNAKAKYDVIILDPPAFTKTKAAIEGATRGYKEINLRAMKLLKEGGYLVSCSCSQHVQMGMFMDIIASSARDARKKLRLVELRTQGKDHPILPAAPETQYLKCAILQVF